MFVGWQNDEGKIRSRTQSIQSAPEVTSHMGRENPYANLLHNTSNNNINEVTFAVMNSSTNNLADNSSIYDRSNHLSTTQTHSSSNLLDTTTSTIEINNDSLTRKNTFTVQKNSMLSNVTNDSGNSTAETADLSNNSGSSTGKKRRRWGLLVGRKSGEKEKSATLGREKSKNKEEKNQLKERHRWSTGLPRLQPLPPTISKETMVSKM